ncbi:MAG: SAM-dependent methyltransferase [Betaproteobacteria bacterium HGW-Betaproteobacteria-11]|nr:MAG: SAM-dependent methyltransferase [Betaproteobacteria bacterium HGW-Betaproteobacteria-11]
MSDDVRTALGLASEQSLELLKELHILTREGRLNQDSRRKLKQVDHLYRFIAPLLAEVVAEKGGVTLVDHGAGKSYLGFILYDRFFRHQETGMLHGIESRAELVDKSRALAARLGFERMQFLASRIEDALVTSELPLQVDGVTALHACDTATDDAIRFALTRQARFIVLVPCCQAEVAAELRRTKQVALSASGLAELWRHPLHSRELGALVTNVLRCLLLEAHGYTVTVTELVGWEHSMKNELILARRHEGKPRGNARERAQAILEAMHLAALSPRFLY